MNTLHPSDPTSIVSSRRSIVAIVSPVTLGLAVLALLGWHFDIDLMKSLVPGAMTMKVNTALGLATGAIALVLLDRRTTSAGRAAMALGTIMLALGAATLAEYTVGLNLGIDEWLYADADAPGHDVFPPGRLAPITAGCFALLAVATLARAWGAGERMARAAAAFVLLASLQTCLGYCIGKRYLFGFAYYTHMALPTAVAFTLLAIGHLRAVRDERRRALPAPEPIARLIRLMVCAAAVVPITTRFLSRWGLARGFYDADTATLLEVTAGTGLLVALILVSSTALRASEARRRRKVDELRERNEEFQALVQTIAQSVWHKDARGVLDTMSTSWSQLTGQNPDESQGWGWLDAIHPDDRAMVRAQWRRCLDDALPYEAEYRLRMPGGEYRWMLARSRPLFASDGGVRGWIGINFDIDARKRAELMQNEARRAAEVALAETRRANELKSAFLANMSHEIRTPLGAILGFAEICAEDDVSPEDLRHHLGIIRRNATHVTTLINEILDLSRIEAGHERVILQSADVVALVREVVTEIEILAERKNLALHVRTPPSAPAPVRTDAQRIKQILTNVIANSIKFTDRGRVCVEIAATPDAAAAFTITVSDTGIGIAPEHHDRIFENFTQVDASDTRRHGGTGLGLTLSRKLARLLGGDLVLLESARDVGSRFAIHVRDHAE